MGGNLRDSSNAAIPAWDPARAVDERVRDLVGRMTLAEKVGQMVNEAPAIPRLGIPAYDWWSEGLHGVGRAGIATVFPQAIGLAAAFDEPFLRRVATAISDEARAKHHDFVRRGKRGRYQGLTYFSPNVNLLPRPALGARAGDLRRGSVPDRAPGRGVHPGDAGDAGAGRRRRSTSSWWRPRSTSPCTADPRSSATASMRAVSEHDLRDSYLPQFEACVREGHVGAVMPAYNRVDGVPCAASPRLLDAILRKEWGFGGFVVSDCGAIDDIYREHRVAGSAEEAAALALRAGTDLNCGGTYRALVGAVKRGLVTEAEIDRAVERLFAARFRLGMFDPPALVPWAQIPMSVVDSPAHRELAKVAAQKSMVLLENRGLVLPLAAGVKGLAVVGPTADDEDVLLGNYNGKPSRAVTILDGIRAKAEARGVSVRYAKGCGIASRSTSGIAGAVEAVRRPEVGVAVVVLGLSPRYEGEEKDSLLNPGGDRRDIALPGVQQRLLEAVVAVGKPTVLVLTGGGALGIEWAKSHVPAILMAWYPGEEGGSAVADVLFGDANPARAAAGHVLPIGRSAAAVRGLPHGGPHLSLFPRRADVRVRLRAQLHDVSLRRAGGRRRRSGEAGTTFEVSVTVENTGTRAGDEVVQLYVARDGGRGVGRRWRRSDGWRVFGASRSRPGSGRR